MATQTDTSIDGYTAVARALKAQGIKVLYGVVGIPVTELASAAQREGIRFISFRNEQAASMAASASGYLTGVPGVCLTVSGPGCINGLAGLANATANCFPMVLISGSCDPQLVGRGAFQELDQAAIATPVAKKVVKISRFSDIGSNVASAFYSAAKGRRGGVYLDIPSSILHTVGKIDRFPVTRPLSPENNVPPSALIQSAGTLLTAAKRPLIIFGKGAAISKAENELKQFVEKTNIPFLATPMGKGLIPDDHELSAGAARSKALREADIVLLVGARLNWILHFGESPKWSESAKIIQIDIAGEEVLKNEKVAVGLVGDATETLSSLSGVVQKTGYKAPTEWVKGISASASKNYQKLDSQLAQAAHKTPLGFYGTYSAIRKVLDETKVDYFSVSEGANTMDYGRMILQTRAPRSRLDAGTWGTMGVGLGYAIAAACEQSKPVLAFEGDSAFGFSGMEMETMVRYNLDVTVLVFNNGGVYGGGATSHFESDPAPTALLHEARYDQMMKALGGNGFFVDSGKELEKTLREILADRSQRPALINIQIDPLAGKESGSMQSHNFQPQQEKSKE